MRILTRFAAPALAGLLALTAGQPAANASGEQPGDFDYYALVLSWSPSFCLSGNGSHADDPQCGTVRPYAFVLHGLWPQFDKGWPESCDTGGADTGVAPDLARSMLDIMPSEKLVGHEYEKHGTCSALGAQNYFGLARKLFTSINIPPKYVNLSDTMQEPLDDLRRDLINANPKFSPDMIAVDCDKHGRLVEVHFCFTKDGVPKTCGRNEVQAKMCRQDTISMPPVRGHAAGASTAATTSTSTSTNAPAAAPVPPASASNTASPSADNEDQTDASVAPETYSRHRHRHHHHHNSFFSGY